MYRLRHAKYGGDAPVLQCIEKKSQPQIWLKLCSNWLKHSHAQKSAIQQLALLNLAQARIGSSTPMHKVESSTHMHKTRCIYGGTAPSPPLHRKEKPAIKLVQTLAADPSLQDCTADVAQVHRQGRIITNLHINKVVFSQQ